jgi:hypothetical protein
MPTTVLYYGDDDTALVSFEDRLHQDGIDRHLNEMRRLYEEDDDTGCDEVLSAAFNATSPTLSFGTRARIASEATGQDTFQARHALKRLGLRAAHEAQRRAARRAAQRTRRAEGAGRVAQAVALYAETPPNLSRKDRCIIVSRQVGVSYQTIDARLRSSV